MKKYIYDIESYPNIFTFSYVSDDNSEKRTFEVSFRKNEVVELFAFLDDCHNNRCFLVGFNNIGFDYPVLHKLIKMRNNVPKNGVTIARKMYQYTQEQIESFNGEFPNTVKESERYIQQIDLFKIHHFDNKARSTSLKMLEFNMRSNNIEDLPFSVGKELTSDECDVLIKYNEHDVQMTRAFYLKSLDMISFREKLTEKYCRNFLNHNDTKIGKDYFIMKLEESGVKVYKEDDKGRRVMNQTKRSRIDIGNCLFDYYDFKLPAFVAIKEWFAKQKIQETKGVFTDIEEHLLGDVAKYAEMSISKKKFKTEPTTSEIEQFKKEHPLGWIDKVELKAKKKGESQYSYWGCWNVAETLNVVVNGFRYDFGVGGIHGSVNNKIARSNKKYVLVDADVSSYYPNMAISNNVYPEHLGTRFCFIYKDMYEQRKSYDKKSAENAMLKLALNGVYGDSNNKFSPFYDTAYTMRITINGQLSLCMLAEKLLSIEGLLVVQINTDGITVALPRNKREQYDKICADWQSTVKLQLEFAEYEKMFIRDVNNYIALYSNGKTKNKGCYEYGKEDDGTPNHLKLGWSKNHSSLVIPMAAEAYMLHGKDVREFIISHNNIYDFMLRTKVPRNSRLVIVDGNGIDVPQQNICRYYPCKSGGKLVKIMPPLQDGGDERRLSIDSQWNVTTCNDISDFKGDIDYDYYVEEANKLIIAVDTPNKTV